MQLTGLTTVQEDALYDWIYFVLGSLGVEIAWEYPDQMEQNKPYCILGVPSKPREEHPPTIEYDSVDTINYRFHDKFTFSVKIYAADGNDYIQRVRRSQYKDSVISLLKTHGLVCRHEVGSYFLPAVVSDRHEYREGVDFIMAYSLIDQEVVGEIRSVEIEGTISGTVDGVDKVKTWNITQ